MDGADRCRRERPEGDLMTPDEIQFEADLATDRATSEPALVVDVEGFEGPLDLLLALARQQKVDLAKISILALADQYLAFIEEARKLRLELAADYLVMAAWLAYLKSRWRCGSSVWKPSATLPSACSAARSSIVMCSGAASPSRSRTSSIRNIRRRSTICSRLTRNNGKRRRSRTCAWSSAPSGRWPRRAKRSSG